MIRKFVLPLYRISEALKSKGNHGDENLNSEKVPKTKKAELDFFFFRNCNEYINVVNTQKEKFLKRIEYDQIKSENRYFGSYPQAVPGNVERRTVYFADLDSLDSLSGFLASPAIRFDLFRNQSFRRILFIYSKRLCIESNRSGSLQEHQFRD